MESEETMAQQEAKHEEIYKTITDRQLQEEMLEDLKPLIGRRVRVPPRPNPLVPGRMQKAFKGILKKVRLTETGALIAEVYKEETGGTYVIAAGWISKRPVKDALARVHKSLAARAGTFPAGPSAAGRAGAGAASSSAASAHPRAPREPRGERTAKPCTCGCGGTTGGGDFLPGHDARLVSMVVKGERPIEVLATFPRLLAKAQGRMGK